jgi:hypothetical protein
LIRASLTLAGLLLAAPIRFSRALSRASRLFI